VAAESGSGALSGVITGVVSTAVIIFVLSLVHRVLMIEADPLERCVSAPVQRSPSVDARLLWMRAFSDRPGASWGFPAQRRSPHRQDEQACPAVPGRQGQRGRGGAKK
jgi:hypothetical protein